MARNRVEYHIPVDCTHSLDVQAGQVVKIGEPVKITGNFQVARAGAGELAVGVVVGGTVGINGVSPGFEGDKKHTATVVIQKPLVHMVVGGAVTAGTKVEVGTAGKLVANATGEPIGIAVSGATADGQSIVVALL